MNKQRGGSLFVATVGTMSFFMVLALVIYGFGLLVTGGESNRVFIGAISFAALSYLCLRIAQGAS